MELGYPPAEGATRTAWPLPLVLPEELASFGFMHIVRTFARTSGTLANPQWVVANGWQRAAHCFQT